MLWLISVPSVWLYSLLWGNYQHFYSLVKRKNMHAFDKQSRKLLSAVTLSRLLPQLHFFNFITSHILLSSIVLFLLTSPSHTLPILLPSSCFSMHSKFQLHTSELHIIENKADMRLLPYFLRPTLTFMKKKRMKSMWLQLKLHPHSTFNVLWHAREGLITHSDNSLRLDLYITFSGSTLMAMSYQPPLEVYETPSMSWCKH